MIQKTLGIIFLNIISISIACAESDERAAVKLINDMEAIYRGKASTATLTMTITSPHYKRTMKMTSQNLGKEFSFIRILSPKKDKGIATLKRYKEMWNFFPKINKRIKVPPSMMMGSWMGSDFTNDDLIKQTTLTEDYALSLKENDSDYTITLVPKEQTITVWGKIEYIVNKEYRVPVAQKFYDEQGKLIRTLDFKAIKNFSGRMIPSVLIMTPLNKKGHKTTIVYDELEFDPEGIVETTFSLRNLKKRT
ncbi:MAG: outer membrane lipoprotein-sorting protein [Pseudomonadales bacterium]|nr:outer membrane lipoprotein-sorting protein [Pseudomonadales bacterium]